MNIPNYDDQLGAVNAATRSRAHEVTNYCKSKGKIVRQLWGYNPASKPEHSAGRAVDYMVYSDKSLGDLIAQYHIDNAARLGVKWIIWYQRIYSFTPGKARRWERMADRGNATTNHKDHVHVFYNESAYKAPAARLKPYDWQAFKRSMKTGIGSHITIGRALLNESDNSGPWNDRDKKLYAAWQRKCGYTGTDADGIPGPDSYRKLLALHGYRLTNVPKK